MQCPGHRPRRRWGAQALHESDKQHADWSAQQEEEVEPEPKRVRQRHKTHDTHRNSQARNVCCARANASGACASTHTGTCESTASSSKYRAAEDQGLAIMTKHRVSIRTAKPSSAPAVHAKSSLTAGGTEADRALCQCRGTTCRSDRHGARHPCTADVERGALFCTDCLCQAGCMKQQLNKWGFCYSHLHMALPKELQLVKAFGDLQLLDQMYPADFQAFLAATCEYEKRHGLMDPALEVLAAWVRDPTAVKTMMRLSPGPNCTSSEMLQVMHNTLRAISGQCQPELDASLQGWHGTGVSACFCNLGIAEKLACKQTANKMAASEMEELVCTTEATDIVVEVGSSSSTFRLIQAGYHYTTQNQHIASHH
jgi:hypothetical protein